MFFACLTPSAKLEYRMKRLTYRELGEFKKWQKRMIAAFVVIMPYL